MQSEDSYFIRGPRILNDHFTIDPLEFGLWNLSYSQAGEDLVVRNMFRRDLKQGYIGAYADIGCFDPRLGSNSYLFYRYGWRGICADANPQFTPLYAALRPRDVFVHAAVGETGTGYWVRDESAAASAVVRSKAEIPPGAQEVLELPFLPLKTLFDRHLPSGVPLDVLFMDIEGSELTALQSNDWGRYRPRIIVLEDNELNADDPSTSPSVVYLRGLGYKVAGIVHPNVFLTST